MSDTERLAELHREYDEIHAQFARIAYPTETAYYRAVMDIGWLLDRLARLAAATAEIRDTLAAALESHREECGARGVWAGWTRRPTVTARRMGGA